MAALCVACEEPLVLNIHESDSESDMEIGDSGASSKASATPAIEVPDDVLLQCGCHYHWS